MASNVIRSRLSRLLKGAIDLSTAAPNTPRSYSRCIQILQKPVNAKVENQHAVKTHNLLSRPLSSDIKSSSKTKEISRVEEESEQDDLFKRVTIELKGHDHAVLMSYTKFLQMTIKELGILLESILMPDKHIQRYTLLKSVHVNKKHRVQYEMRTHYRVVKVKNLTGSTADTFLEYIQRNLPEGMAMKVTKERIERIPDHLTPQTVSTAS